MLQNRWLSAQRRPAGLNRRRALCISAASFLFLTLLHLPQASAQAVAAAAADGVNIMVGVSGSGDYLQYGEHKMLGYTVFSDFNTRQRFGVEAEMSHVQWRQTANVQTTTYLAGPRYYFHRGNWQFYAKALVGRGEFDFPYQYASGSYLVVAPGGGVDYRLNRFLHLRPLDVEYQRWPQFTFGSMSAMSIRVGIMARVY
jgi:hypothetical protein